MSRYLTRTLSRNRTRRILPIMFSIEVISRPFTNSPTIVQIMFSTCPCAMPSAQAVNKITIAYCGQQKQILRTSADGKSKSNLNPTRPTVGRTVGGGGGRLSSMSGKIKENPRQPSLFACDYRFRQPIILFDGVCELLVPNAYRENSKVDCREVKK